MSDDYEFRVQVMDQIKNLRGHIDELYGIVQNLELKKQEEENQLKEKTRILVKIGDVEHSWSLFEAIDVKNRIEDEIHRETKGKFNETGINI